MGTDYAWKTADGEKIFATGSGTTRPIVEAVTPPEPLQPRQTMRPITGVPARLATPPRSGIRALVDTQPQAVTRRVLSGA